MTRRPIFLRDTRGAASAELALLLPLMLMLMFAGFEAGHYFYTEHKIIKAVREGARYGGRLTFASYDCTNGTVVAAAETDIKNVTRTGTVTGTQPRIKGWVANDITVTLACDATTTTGIFSGNGTNGAPVITVQAVANYPSLFETLGTIESSSVVTASAQAVVNGI